MIDLTSLQNKVENDGATAQGRLASSEFNTLVNAAIELQDKSVRSISFNSSTPIEPDADGNVNIVIAQGDYEQILTLKYNGDVLSGDASILSADGNVVVGVQYSESEISQSGQDVSYVPTGQIVTLSVIGINAATGNQTELFSRSLASVGHGSTAFTDIDISNYLSGGEQNIQFRITNTINANPKQQQVTIIKAGLELRIESDAAWYRDAKLVAGVSNPSITARYIVLGNVTKTLHVKFTGVTASKTVDVVDIATNSPTEIITASFMETTGNNIGFFGTNGVREVEAWITCTYGEQTVESNHIKNQIIIVADASTATPLIAVQGLIEIMANYETETIFSWNMYNPSLDSGDTSDVIFYIANQDRSITWLTQIVENVENNTIYPFSQNVSIESSNNYIDVYVYADVDGTPISAAEIAFFQVDNTVDYSPVAGADFYLNPGLRSNSETNPAKIINAATDTEIANCVFENMSFEDGVDGWMTDSSGIRIFRIPAGGRVTIPYDIYSEFTANSRHYLTIEIDMAARSVTNEDDPVITIGNRNASNPKGLYIKPLNGAFVAASQTIWENADMSWQENVRVHQVYNICYNYTLANPDTSRGTDQPATKTISIIREYLDAKINKEYTFDPTESTEINAGGNIVLGQDGCILDIYCIRIYKDTNEKANVEPTGVLKNRISVLPTGSERAELQEANDILSGGLISLAKSVAAGYNCIVWHGLPVNKNNSNDTYRYGYAEIYRHNSDGTLDRAHSGILYGVRLKGQGTTAMGYPEWNVQHQEDKKTGAGHDEYKYNDNGTLRQVFVDLDGNVGFGGTKFGYKLESGDPLAKKLVGKVNYASSMQTHKMGACNLYNDLYAQIVTGSMTDFANGERVTVKEEPFMYFVQRTEGNDDSLKVFQGMMTYGPGKADKPTWGVSDADLAAGDCILEGALNNNPLTDFRVPFVDTGAITYSVSNEAFMYAGIKNLNFDFGDTADLHDGQGAWEYVVQDAAEASSEVPTTAQVKLLQPVVNFLYLTNVSIKPWAGTLAELNTSAMDDDFDYKSAYWINGSGSGYNRFDLYRCHYAKNGTEESREFVPAGLRLVQGVKTYYNLNCLYNLNAETTRPSSHSSADMWYDTDGSKNRTLTFNLKDELEAFLGITITYTGVSAEALNTVFKTHLANIFATYVNSNLYLHKLSHLFHHEIMKFWAGTDNRSKNTYYRFNPHANQQQDESYRPNMEMNDDDLDTIFKTNNAGIQSKPYYILEHDTDSEDRTYWDGQDNVLNNNLEATYGRALGLNGDRQNELQAMMNTIFTRMAALVGVGDTMPDGTAIPTTPQGCMDKYFFRNQKYFPAVAWNEQARIRYEVPATFYMSEQPAQAPLTQSLGDQYDSEREYVKRRIIMLAGYAGYELDMLSFRGYLGQYVASITPHFWIYPMSKLGNPADAPMKSNVRVAAGETYSLAMGTAVSGNTIFLHFINELSDIGNIGLWGNGNKDGDASTEIAFTSERLRSFKCYGNTAADVTFPLSVADISGSTNIETINCRNCSTLTSFRNGITALMRLQSVDLRGTAITNLALPQTTTLTEVRLPAGFQVINITKCPNLATLSVGDFTGLTRLVIAEPVAFDSLDFVMGCYAYNSALAENVIQNLTLTNINWTGVTTPFLIWLLTVPNLTLTGRIQMATSISGQMTFALKKQLIDKFGDIDSESNPLYISYVRSALSSVTITGDGYFDHVDEVKYYDLIPNVVSGNTIRSYEWSIVGGSQGIDPEDYVSIDDYGNVTCLEMGVESGGTGPTVTIGCLVHLYDGSMLTLATATIRCYKRQAQIGDYVYHDGTWDDRLNVSKTPIGICFYCKQIYDNGEPTGVYDRRMVALHNANSRVWGLYPNGAAIIGQYGFPSSGDNALTYNLNGVATSPFNVPNLTEFTTGNGLYCTYANMIDTSNPSSEFPATDPQRYWKSYANLHSMGYLNPVELGATLKNNIFGTDDLYESDTLVPQGFADTAYIIFHRNRVLSGTTYDNGTPNDPSDDTNYTYFKPDDDDRDKLSTAILNIQNFAREELESSYPAIYQQYLYPAASECFAYEPTVANGQTLNAKFTANHWYLPSVGELARLCFLGRTCYNQASNYEADAYNIFGDIFANAADAGIFTRFSTSNHWSSSDSNQLYAWAVNFASGLVNPYVKYGTGVVRPCAAF